jgi:hypothetical protein
LQKHESGQKKRTPYDGLRLVIMGGILTARHLLDTWLHSGVLRVWATASLIHVKAAFVHPGPARAGEDDVREPITGSPFVQRGKKT